MAKRKAKSGKKTKAGRKRKKPSRSLFYRVMHGVLVAGLWGAIALGCVLGWYALELPSLVENPNVTRKPLITVNDINGHVIARYGAFKSNNVRVEDLPPYMVQAVVAIEDRRFYDHFGIDPIGLTRALVHDILAGHIVQGGSTITQQLAKNLFLSRERTLKRKIQEAMLAIWLEHKMTKNEILSAYLNRVYLGSGAYGLEAAAQAYFHKSARNVTLHEAAILAGLLKAPSRYNPRSNPKLAEERANTVLAAMEEEGYITKAQEKKQLALSETKIKETQPEDSDSAHYFTDWVISDLDNLIGTPGEDIVIDTTFVPSIQKTAQDEIDKVISTDGKARHISQGAAMVMARDGAVLAMVGGKDYAESQFNRAVQAYRPPGSSFKPVVYLTALEHGYTPDTLIDGSPVTTGKYRPSNYDHEDFGEIPLYEALAYSLNTASYRLTKDVGVGYVIGAARRLGIEAPLARDLSLSLGSSGIPMIQMVTAYGTIANDGYQVTPYAILRITDKNGTLIYSRPPYNLADGRAMFEPELVEQLKGMMQGVVEFGTGVAARFGLPIAGKTGTSQDFRDAWFTGFSDQYVASVWLGNDDNSPMKRVTGGSFPARIWRTVMMAAHDSGKGRNLSAPSLSGSLMVATEPGVPTGEQDTPDSFGELLHRLLPAGPAAQDQANGPPAPLPPGFALSPPPSIERPRTIRRNAQFND